MSVDTVIKKKNKELLNLLHDDLGTPLNEWAVAAWLETSGIRDVDAQEDYDKASVFDLASELYGQFSTNPALVSGQNQQTKNERIGSGRTALKKSFDILVMLVRKYVKGLEYSFPLFFQLISLVIFGYALWVWLLFNEAQATMISLATVGSFILTGGFSQVISREISRYRNQDNPVLLAKITLSVLKTGILVLLASVLAVTLLNLLIPFYPMTFIIIGGIYVLLIGLLSLLSAALFAMDWHIMVLLGYVIGTAVVVVFMRYTNLGIYYGNWLGLTAANGFMWLYLQRTLISNMREVPRWMRTLAAPGKEVLLWQNYQYLIYGSAYFLFLFIDRILAWSASPHLSGYAIWFRTPYELGMDWALLSLVLTMGILEYSVHSFSVKIRPLQKKYSATDVNGFSKEVYNKYWRHLGLVVFVGLLATFFVYGAGMLILWQWGDYQIINDFFSNSTTVRVFWIASISYLFFSIALLHILHFFVLNRPDKALIPLASSLLINFGVGFLTSRWISYDFADIGLLAGTVFLAIYTGLLFRHYIRHIDFYYYSAY